MRTLMLEILHHCPFHMVLDQVHDGADEPTPIRKLGSLTPCPKPYKSNTRTCIEIVSDGLDQLQKYRWRCVH